MTLISVSLVAAGCHGDDATADTPGDQPSAIDRPWPANTGGINNRDDTNATATPTTGIDAAATNNPTMEIGPTIPLTLVPPVGKTVARLACDVTCEAMNPGFEAATEMLGWNLEIIEINTLGPAGGVQQALDRGVDYIAITGVPPALYQDQLDDAIDDKVPVMSCFELTVPKQEANGIWTQCGDALAVEATGYALSSKIIAESAGTAHELMVNVQDIPILASGARGGARAYADFCPVTCEFTELNLTLNQLMAGETADAIISAIQRDESITHVRFSFDSLAIGVADVLEDAGLLDDVTLVGQDLSTPIAHDIIDGKQAFWTANPMVYASWLMVDAMARHSVGQDNPEERSNAKLPVYFVDSAEKAAAVLATGGDWPGPGGMEKQFAALWGVG